MRVHVIYEHEGDDLRPYGSSHLRLIRPLSHPASGVVATFGHEPPQDGEEVDGVIVDRLWRGDATAGQARELVESQLSLGRWVVHALDDDFAQLEHTPESGGRDRAEVAEAFATSATGLLVTTAALAERCKRWNRRVQVVPNSLDERLIARREPRPRKTAFGERPLVVGVMGTRTHDHDLAVVRDAIELLGSRSDVAFEVCGAVTDQSWWRDRGVRVRDVSGPEEEYPLFMTWWSESIAWDVGLAALAPTVFNASKSDVKVLDYAAIAAAGVYSAGPAYDESIRHGESGLLVEYEARAWADAIATLAADDELRLALARRAVSDLWSGRVLAHRAPDWAEALAAMVSS